MLFFTLLVGLLECQSVIVEKKEAALFWRQINPKTTQQLTERLVPGSELAVVAL
jgi:hypothetical protein